MAPTIDYFFTAISPFAWLGHETLMAIAERHGKQVAFRPFDLPGVWNISGSVPLGERSPTRRRYRHLELQRIAELRGLALNPSPKHFPVDPELADRCVIAAAEPGSRPSGFVFRLGEAVWTRDLDISDEAVLADLLEAQGHDAARVLEKAKAPATGETRRANTQAAIEADAIGAPSYVYRGEVFWGQDRLEYLDRMIASGRDPYSAN